jgi:hypothetical protein
MLMYNSKDICNDFNKTHEELLADIQLFIKKARMAKVTETLGWFIPHLSTKGIEHFMISEDGYDALAFLEVTRFIKNKSKK